MELATEHRILKVASDLLERYGPDRLNTRAVCAAAKVTAPTLYHHFGDKAGLLDAIVLKGVAEFMAVKRASTGDPIEELKHGWDRWIEFAVSRPTLFKLMLERAAREPEIAAEAQQLMKKRVEAVVAAGVLCGPVEIAVDAIQAASNGVLALLAQGADRQRVLKIGEILFQSVVRQLARSDVLPGG